MMSSEKKRAAYQQGVVTLMILAVLTAVEYWVGVASGSVVWLFLLALLKAVVIVQNFMHIARLWRSPEHEESH